MSKVSEKILKHKKRKLRIRKRIFGTAERPRVSVFRSNKNIYVQAIDDEKGHTILSYTTMGKNSTIDQVNVKSAFVVGEEFGKLLLDRSITQLVLDRNGKLYHGVVKAFAEGSRKVGIKF